ncbi:MAG: LytTR family DNA-binding domain-containing protein [Defluviitaleaceae bacterium]|nr:LytTR family DNA-binding domain-containing protein [Defluviitaleaceae bacterium]
MEKLEIAVCDDNKQALLAIAQQLEALAIAADVHTFSDTDSFMLSIECGKHYDAVLMDIDWGSTVTGIDIAAELYNISPKTGLIYVTGYVDKYSQHIFLNRANLSGFLVKPVDMGLLQANLQKIADTLPYESQPAIVLRQKGVPIPIPLKEIYFIKSHGHTVEVYTENEVVTAYDKLDNIMGALPMGFYRCHKSFIINMGQIRRFEASEIVLKNGKQVPVSRARYAAAKDAYFGYMGQRF